jgi:hypothetical protein
MLEAARTVRDFMMGIESVHEYLKDRKLQLAIERAVETLAKPHARFPSLSGPRMERSRGVR